MFTNLLRELAEGNGGVDGWRNNGSAKNSVYMIRCWKKCVRSVFQMRKVSRQQSCLKLWAIVQGEENLAVPLVGSVWLGPAK